MDLSQRSLKVVREVYGEALTIMPTMPWASYSVALLPYFLRVWHSSNSANNLMSRYDWEAITESCLLDSGIRVARRDRARTVSNSLARKKGEDEKKGHTRLLLH